MVGMSQELFVDGAWTAYQFSKDLKHLDEYNVANNCDQKQLERVHAKRWLGANGTLRFGLHWTEPVALPVTVPKKPIYRYLDSRLQPYKRIIGDPLEHIDLSKKKKRVKHGLAGDLHKLTATATAIYYPSPEENFRLGRIAEFPQDIPPCQCGFGSRFHRSMPPTPNFSRTWSDPHFATRRPFTADAILQRTSSFDDAFY